MSVDNPFCCWKCAEDIAAGKERTRCMMKATLKTVLPKAPVDRIPASVAASIRAPLQDRCATSLGSEEVSGSAVVEPAPYPKLIEVLGRYLAPKLAIKVAQQIWDETTTKASLPSLSPPPNISYQPSSDRGELVRQLSSQLSVVEDSQQLPLRKEVQRRLESKVKERGLELRLFECEERLRACLRRVGELERRVNLLQSNVLGATLPSLTPTSLAEPVDRRLAEPGDPFDTSEYKRKWPAKL